MMAAKSTSTSAPSHLLATVHTALAPAVNATRRRNPFFARGEDVEVRRRLGKVFGNTELVMYLRAKVVSVSAGTFSYLVQYPAANSVPGRTARVAAFDVRAARRAPPPAVDVARPASSKRTLPSEQSERDGGDCCKKAKKMGKGIPVDVLERLIAEHEKEEEAKKKARKSLLPAPAKAAVAGLQPSR